MRNDTFSDLRELVWLRRQLERSASHFCTEKKQNMSIHCPRGNVWGSFELISIFSSAVSFQASEKEFDDVEWKWENHRGGTETLDCHPETCSWFVGYWLRDSGMWKGRQSCCKTDVYHSGSLKCPRNVELLLKWYRSAFKSIIK